MATQKRFGNIKDSQGNAEYFEYQWSIQSAQTTITEDSGNTLQLVFYITPDDEDEYTEALELPLYLEPPVNTPQNGKLFAALAFTGGELFVLAHRYVDGQKLRLTPFRVSSSLFDKGASLPVGSFRAKHFRTMEQEGRKQKKIRR